MKWLLFALLLPILANCGTEVSAPIVAPNQKQGPEVSSVDATPTPTPIPTASPTPVPTPYCIFSSSGQTVSAPDEFVNPHSGTSVTVTVNGTMQCWSVENGGPGDNWLVETDPDVFELLAFEMDNYCLWSSNSGSRCTITMSNFVTVTPGSEFSVDANTTINGPILPTTTENFSTSEVWF